MTIKPLYQRLKSQFPTRSDSKRIKDLSGFVDGTFNAVERVVEHSQKVAANRDLSLEGRAKKVREFAADAPMRIIFDARRTVDRTRKQIDAELASLKPGKPDPANFAGALVRSQIRQSFLVNDDFGGVKAALIAGTNRELVEAVMEAPCWLFRLTPADYEAAENQFVQVNHPDVIERIEAEREAAAVVQAMIDGAQGSIRSITAFEDDLSWVEWVKASTAPLAAEVAKADLAAEFNTDAVINGLFSLPSSKRESVLRQIRDRSIAEMERESRMPVVDTDGKVLYTPRADQPAVVQ